MSKNTSLSPAKLSEQEIDRLVGLLSRLEPGFLPLSVFHAVARLVALPIVEVVPLRVKSAGGVEILLLRRPADDPVWPNQLHVPGTVVRASDEPGFFDDALARVLAQELDGTSTSSPVFVKSMLHMQARGMEAAQIFWVLVEGEPTEGTFYDADDLPEALVATQLDFIPVAVAHFKHMHQA